MVAVVEFRILLQEWVMGRLKFLSNTDIRWMDLDKVVKFNRHSVSVYENEEEKPLVVQELNKTGEVTLILQLKSFVPWDLELDKVITSLRKSSERQEAHFLYLTCRLAGGSSWFTISVCLDWTMMKKRILSGMILFCQLQYH